MVAVAEQRSEAAGVMGASLAQRVGQVPPYDPFRINAVEVGRRVDALMGPALSLLGRAFPTLRLARAPEVRVFARGSDAVRETGRDVGDAVAWVDPRQPGVVNVNAQLFAAHPQGERLSLLTHELGHAMAHRGTLRLFAMRDRDPGLRNLPVNLAPGQRVALPFALNEGMAEWISERATRKGNTVDGYPAILRFFKDVVGRVAGGEATVIKAIAGDHGAMDELVRAGKEAAAVRL